MPNQPQTRLFLRRLDAAHQPAGDPREQFGSQSADFPQRPVGGKHQLAAIAKQGVDRVLEFDDRRPLAAEELDVVDQQHVHVAVLAAKAGQTAALQGLQKVRGELLGGHQHDAFHAAQPPGRVRHALQQVRLARSRRPVHQQRRHLTEVLQHALGSRKGHAIAGSEHKFVQRRQRPATCLRRRRAVIRAGGGSVRAAPGRCRRRKRLRLQC